MTTRKPDLPSDEAAARGVESGMDSDPYLVSLARQGRRRFPAPSARPLAEPTAAAGDTADARDTDPYLVGLARGVRLVPGDRD